MKSSVSDRVGTGDEWGASERVNYFPVATRCISVADRFSTASLVPVGALAVLVLFLFAVQLLGTATRAAAPTLREVVPALVVGDAGALGVSWLSAYGLGNGSVVAALSLSLFTADLLTPSQLFLMVAGSRAGAAAIVVFIGALDFVQKRRFSLRESVSMGVLTFLVTHSIYLPATVLGYAVLPVLDPTGLSGIIGLSASPLQLFEPATAAITAAVGPAVAFVLAVTLLFGSLQLFDSVLEHVDTGTLRDRFFSHLRRTHISFLIGLLVTTATTSVAFSLGVIVPLYNRGYVERDELVPYVLGANLGTVFDTLVVAIVLESGAGVAVVLTLLGSATLVTLLALVLHDRYTRGIATVDELLLADRRLFVAFLASLLVVPLALVIGPLWLG